MLEWKKQGWGIKRIAKALNNRGIPVKGKKGVVQRLVSGRMVFGAGLLPVPLFGKDNEDDGAASCGPAPLAPVISATGLIGPAKDAMSMPSRCPLVPILSRQIRDDPVTPLKRKPGGIILFLVFVGADGIKARKKAPRWEPEEKLGN